jgi:hypothetical protein
VGQTIAIIETEGEMVAVVKAAASQEAVAEVTKQLTLLKIVLQRQLISLILINSFSFSEKYCFNRGVSVAELNKSMVQEKIVELLK